jgi:phosphohistidine phosphatase
MKHIWLVRHGRASQAGSGIEDADRRLDARGREDCRRMARRMRHMSVHPDFIVSSPAVRAVETAGLFRRGLGVRDGDIHLEDALYHDASAAALLQVIRTVPEEKSTILLIGHNPAITDCLRALTDSFLPVFPKSGAICLTAGSGSWREVNTGSCSVLWFDFGVNSGRVRKVRARLVEEAHGRLVSAVSGVLSGMRIPIPENAEKEVSLHCLRIADHIFGKDERHVLRYLRFDASAGPEESEAGDVAEREFMSPRRRKGRG